ncbi:hypothetical protein ACIODT_27990 [Streptomyces sp. NPDC088251]|uniref:hypothetical protein n=1 Tax=unclassified Streptomyces TaxID=2593676 RepID=UPI003827B255
MWQCAVAWGGDCLADVAPLSAEPGVFGPVTCGPTASPPVNTPVSSGKHAPTRDPPGPRPRPRTRLGPSRHCRPDSGGRAAVDLDEVLVILYGVLVIAHMDRQDATSNLATAVRLPPAHGRTGRRA